MRDVTADPVEPPGDTYTRQRWIRPGDIEWAQKCDRILIEHDAVRGLLVYPTRRKAQWRAQKLIGLLNDLHIRPRWQLREHTSPVEGGYLWTVEYTGRYGDGFG